MYNKLNKKYEEILELLKRKEFSKVGDIINSSKNIDNIEEIYGLSHLLYGARLGHRLCLYKLGLTSKDLNLDTMNLECDLVLFAAENGYALAQQALGLMYMQGEFKDQELDPYESIKWYLKAAEQGLGESQMVVGNAYHYGYGVTADKTVALEWYLKAYSNEQPVVHEIRLIDHSVLNKFQDFEHLRGYL